jgi:two-component system, LuxR family, response regulator FixJ
MAKTSSCNIAVVDDDTAVLDSFRFVLELSGYQVATYSSAMAFLENDRAQAHCLILDQHMPSMTGLELVTRLRADGRNIPIMLVTAAPSPVIAARAAELGIDEVFEKPPSEEDLLRFITRCS